MSTYLKLFSAIEAEVLGADTEKAIPTLPVAAQTNLRAIRKVERLAAVEGISINITNNICVSAPKHPSTITPVILADISGSMVTPENKALCLLVADKLRTSDTPQFFGCHTQGLYFATPEEFVENMQTGGTILSSGLRKVVEVLTPNYRNALNLYYLTDGDNWHDDDATFKAEVETMFNTGEVNRMVVHVTRNSNMGTVRNFMDVCEDLAREFQGFSVVTTSNHLSEARANANEAYEGFLI